MKRAATALAALGIAALSVAPAAAAVTTQGAVKMTWNVSPSATLNITTNYSSTGAQGTGASSLFPSAAGVCANGTTETGWNLTFGNLTPSTTAAVQCLYQNAVSAKVVTNSSNWTITQGLSAAAPTGVSFCGYANGSAGTAVTQSSRTGTGFLGTATCTGNAVPVVSGGTVSGTAAGDPTTTGVVQATGSTVGGTFCSGTASGTMYCGEDVGIILAANTAVTTSLQSAFLVIQLVAN